MVFPGVMYGCESWTIKKTGRQRIDAFRTVLEKAPESPLNSKKIKLFSIEGNQPWILIGRTDAEAWTCTMNWCAFSNIWGAFWWTVHCCFPKQTALPSTASHCKRLRTVRLWEVFGWQSAWSYGKRAWTSAHYPKCEGQERCSPGNVMSTPIADMGQRSKTNQYALSQQLTRQHFAFWVYSRQKAAHLYLGYHI